MKPALRRIHRYLSLALALVWCVQLATGALLVFAREYDDATLAGPARPFDAQALGRRIEALPAAGLTFKYLQPSGGKPGRYDLFVARGDQPNRILRIDGQGAILRERPSGSAFPAPGLMRTALKMHETLFLGANGLTFMGVSGIVLLSNIVIGLKLAWPMAGQWRRALWPRRSKTPAGTLFGWHRAAGLAIGLPLAVTVTAGIVLAIGDPVKAALNGSWPTPQVAPGGAVTVSPGQAMTLALARHPGATLSLMMPPSDERPFWRVEMRQPGELRRVFGGTRVLVDARDGRILADNDALKAPPMVAVFQSFYAIHTGEAAGLAGRILLLAVTLGGLALGVMGVLLWTARRRLRRG